MEYGILLFFVLSMALVDAIGVCLLRFLVCCVLGPGFSGLWVLGFGVFGVL